VDAEKAFYEGYWSNRLEEINEEFAYKPIEPAIPVPAPVSNMTSEELALAQKQLAVTTSIVQILELKQQLSDAGIADDYSRNSGGTIDELLASIDEKNWYKLDAWHRQLTEQRLVLSLDLYLLKTSRQAIPRGVPRSAMREVADLSPGQEVRFEALNRRAELDVLILMQGIKPEWRITPERLKFFITDAQKENLKEILQVVGDKRGQVLERADRSAYYILTPEQRSVWLGHRLYIHLEPLAKAHLKPSEIHELKLLCISEAKRASKFTSTLDIPPSSQTVSKTWTKWQDKHPEHADIPYTGDWRHYLATHNQTSVGP